MHLKFTAQKESSPPFHDFWRDYDNLNVAIDPNVS